MTEDEIEEQSFRSLLPSKSHRRINLKKRSHQVYSDEEASEKPTLSPVKARFQKAVPVHFLESQNFYWPVFQFPIDYVGILFLHMF